MQGKNGKTKRLSVKDNRLKSRKPKAETPPRIDETIMFLPLNEKEIKQIVLLQIKGVQKMLAENGVELKLTEGALAVSYTHLRIRLWNNSTSKVFPGMKSSTKIWNYKSRLVH